MCNGLHDALPELRGVQPRGHVQQQVWLAGHDLCPPVGLVGVLLKEHQGAVHLLAAQLQNTERSSVEICWEER